MNGNLIFNKKGQLTPIIIIAIIVVVGILVYFSVGDSSNQRIVDPDIAPINNLITNCFVESGAEAIVEVSKYGGYFIPLEDRSLPNGIPLYMIDGKNVMPTKERVETELGNYVDTLMYFCTKEFSDFPDFNVEVGEIETIVDINEQVVEFKSVYPLTISKGENVYDLKNFEYSVDSRLGLIFNQVVSLMDDQVNYPDGLCMDCAVAISLEHDLFIDNINVDNNIYVYTIRDDQVKVGGEDLIYSYAVELEEYEL